MTDSQKLIDAFDARVERRENRRAFFTNALSVAAVGGAFVYATPPPRRRPRPRRSTSTCSTSR